MWWLKSPMVGSIELSLVLFTVLTQMAVGAVAFLLFTRLRQNEQVVSAGAAALTRQVVYISLALMVVAGVASLFHLGQAVRAYRALVYHLSSWMGKEALFIGLFTLSILVYAVLLTKGIGPKTGIEFFAVIVGVLGVLSSSFVYSVLGSVPSWNNLFSAFFFLLTFILLGASLFGAIIMHRLKSDVDVVRNPAESYMRAFVSVLTPVLIAAIVLTGGYLFYLGGRGPEASASMHSLTGSALFWLRIATGLIAPLFLVLYMKKLVAGGETLRASSYVYGVFILLLAGEILGRVLFFSSSVMHTIGGNGTPY
jgi:anaerobic dimethyl sulfoxide reductase subunit C (anchor subunit)